jgi:glycosyltransferase involved in cell wall biosynthesis
MEKKMKVLVIIPAYNEEHNIINVIEKLKGDNPNADYIIVNDCSTDQTARICQENHYHYISLPINLGIGGGVQTGYLYAMNNNYDIAVQIDGDGQHDSYYLDKLIAPILEGRADIVIGSRYIAKEGFQSSLARRAGITLLSRIIKLCYGVHINDVTSGFRAVNRRMIKAYAKHYAQDYPEPEAITLGALCNARILEVPVSMNERANGMSSISSFKSIYYMIKVSIAIIINRIIFDRKSVSI